MVYKTAKLWFIVRGIIMSRRRWQGASTPHYSTEWHLHLQQVYTINHTSTTTEGIPPILIWKVQNARRCECRCTSLDAPCHSRYSMMKDYNNYIFYFGQNFFVQRTIALVPQPYIKCAFQFLCMYFFACETVSSARVIYILLNERYNTRYIPPVEPLTHPPHIIVYRYKSVHLFIPVSKLWYAQCYLFHILLLYIANCENRLTCISLTTHSYTFTSDSSILTVMTVMSSNVCTVYTSQ